MGVGTNGVGIKRGSIIQFIRREGLRLTGLKKVPYVDY